MLMYIFVHLAKEIEFLGKNNKTYNEGLHHRHIAPKTIKHYVEPD